MDSPIPQAQAELYFPQGTRHVENDFDFIFRGSGKRCDAFLTRRIFADCIKIRINTENPYIYDAVEI